MIQRVQSVYLLLVTVLMSFLLLRPYAEVNLADGHALIFRVLKITNFANAESWETYRTSFVLFLLVVISGLLSFINIFLFSKRVIQMRICFINTFLLFIVAGMMFVYYISIQNALPHVHNAFRLGAIFPVMSIILNFMAYRAIHQDELLVDSYNRIR
jgi:hypothetical protein